CVYSPTVQQGNLVDQEKVDQIEVGMTRNQVRFLLGSPLVDDPFNRDRWDYLYYVRAGSARSVERHWITVYFDGDTVARLTRGDPPPEATANVEAD
ncbi:MAG: outer membrane protein assembly factor BamE, partial [Pseudomonadota bacterium]